MKTKIIIQDVCTENWSFSKAELRKWVLLTLQIKNQEGELTLRFVDPLEMQTLNNQYRKQNKATNVLSFPMPKIPNIKLKINILGDIIICPAVLQQESEHLNKTFKEHLSHIVVHGVLHILGYDHEEEHEAKIMQAEEIKILKLLGFSNPYKENDSEYES